MNEIYFACTDCRIYIDAGYRHAYWTIEHPEVVDRKSPINADAILNTVDYWDACSAEWLEKLLPKVKLFLEAHRDHHVMYGDWEQLELIPMHDGDYRCFDWLMDAGFSYEELPRYYVERLKIENWQQVIDHINKRVGRPWWWLLEETRNAAEQKFLELVRAQRK